MQEVTSNLDFGEETFEIDVDDMEDESICLEILHNSSPSPIRIQRLQYNIGHLAEKLETSRDEVLKFRPEFDAGAVMNKIF